MASLKIISDRCDDNSLKFAVVLPPRRNGEVNFGAAEAINRALYSITPDAYDPAPVHHAIEAPMPPVIDELPLDSDENPGLTAGTAVSP